MTTEIAAKSRLSLTRGSLREPRINFPSELLARTLLALSDPYCQLTCLCVCKFDAKCLGN